MVDSIGFIGYGIDVVLFVAYLLGDAGKPVVIIDETKNGELRDSMPSGGIDGVTYLRAEEVGRDLTGYLPETVFLVYSGFNKGRFLDACERTYVFTDMRKGTVRKVANCIKNMSDYSVVYRDVCMSCEYNWAYVDMVLGGIGVPCVKKFLLHFNEGDRAAALVMGYDGYLRDTLLSEEMLSLLRDIISNVYEDSSSITIL